MQKSKNFVVFVSAICIVVLLIAFWIFRDDTKLLSPYEFAQIIEQSPPHKLIVQEDMIHFSIGDKSYKVARESIDLHALNPKIAVSVKPRSGGFLDEVGLFVLIFIGLAVVIKAISMLFTRPPKEPIKYIGFMCIFRNFLSTSSSSSKFR